MEHIQNYVYDLLKAKLPSYTFYHTIQHTKQVTAFAKHIAECENVNEHDSLLVKTAALFHDTGYTVSSIEHEQISCDIARKALPEFNFTDNEIEDICTIIVATKIPQLPTNYLAEILCDADLSYLGMDIYFADAETLYEEFSHLNPAISHDSWLQQQIDFLNAHHYFTQTAKNELSAVKATNLSVLINNLTHLKKPKKNSSMRLLQDVVLILIGVITAGFALKGFLVPNNFFDGGVSGISLLIHELYHFNLAYVIVLANLPLVILGSYLINKGFALKTMLCIFLLALCLLFFPYPVITSDKLLVSIFGGFFLGIGIGLTMRAGCALDGIEVLAMYTRRKTSFTVTEIVLAINTIIFLIAAFKFGLPTSLYSMLTYFAASKTVDYVVEGIEAYTGVTIISGKSEIIKGRLVNELGRGITIYKGERGYLPGKFEVHHDTDIIFTVITRLELRKLKDVVYDTYPLAFVFASVIKEASGGILKRRQAH